MTIALSFLAGVMVGTCVGIFIVALMRAASDADDAMERALWLSRHTCGPSCAPQAGLHRTPWGERIGPGR